MCVARQIRNILKDIFYKNRKEISRRFQANLSRDFTEEDAQIALEIFETKWSKRYLPIVKSWHSYWNNLVIFLQYPGGIRKMSYTTNAYNS